MTLFPVGKVLTKGVKVDLMEDLTSYALWNEFRSRFSDMYKEPSKVIMNDFDQIYPELLEDVRFPKFTKDYTEVITVVLIECFHSRGQHLCKFIRTKEIVCIRKEFNS